MLEIVYKDPSRYERYRVDPNNQLYYFKPNLIKETIGDNNAWEKILKENEMLPIITEHHCTAQSAHQGINKTYLSIINHFYWPGMREDIKRYVNECEICLKCKPKNTPPQGLIYPRKITEPWETVSLDIVGPLPRSKSGKNYILVCEDTYTRYIDCFALSKADGPKIVKSLNTLVNRWGAPTVVITDNGTEFVNRNITSFLQKIGSVQRTTPVYHPQANPVERVNRNLKTMLASLLGENQREWDVLLEVIQFAYNTTVHTSLGVTPAFLNFAREPRRTGEPLRDVNTDANSDETIDTCTEKFLDEQLYLI